MSEKNYKDEIVATRIGCLGSSDGKLIQNVWQQGGVPKSAYERLAIVKGLIEPSEKPTTTEMRYGDYIEQQIYAHLVLNCDIKNCESNPLWVSKRFSRKNVKLICHPDIVIKDENKKILNVYEVKTTKFNVKATKETYRAQMYIEHEIARDIVLDLGEEWAVRLFLVHYDTSGDEVGAPFNPDNMTIHQMRFSSIFNIGHAMNIIDAFLDTFNDYYRGDEIDSTFMPATVQEEFAAVTTMLREIKEREKAVDAFKEKLYLFMLEKDIKSIKNEEWSITRVDETESVSFNAKAFLEDYTKKYPRKAAKLKKEYEKRTKRKGYVNIKIKN